MENETPKSPEQLELEAATQRLTEAKQAVAKRERMLLDKAAADIAAYRAAEEAKLIEQRREVERIEKLHAERKAKQAEAELRERQAQVAEQQRLEMEFNARREEMFKREEHERSLKQIAETAFALEQEEQRLAAELLRDTPLPAVDPTYTAVISEATCNDDSQGRARLFSRTLSAQTQHEVVSQTAIQADSSAIPPEYSVKDGKISERVFANRFGREHAGNFFQSLSNGNLILNGYVWNISDSLSNRTWRHGQTVFIAQENGAYWLQTLTGERVGVTPLTPVEGCIFEPLDENEGVTA